MGSNLSFTESTVPETGQLIRISLNFQNVIRHDLLEIEVVELVRSKNAEQIKYDGIYNIIRGSVRSLIYFG